MRAYIRQYLAEYKVIKQLVPRVSINQQFETNVIEAIRLIAVGTPSLAVMRYGPIVYTEACARRTRYLLSKRRYIQP